MDNPETNKQPLSRRTLVGAAAWTAPAVMMTAASPAAAASPGAPAPSEPTLTFSKIPPMVKPGEVFGDLVVSATTDGVTPVSAGTFIHVFLTDGLTFADGSTSKDFRATGAIDSVTISGIRTGTAKPAVGHFVSALCGNLQANALLFIDAVPVPPAGKVYAWGYNYSGEAGDTTAPANVHKPFRWPVAERFTAITGAHGTFHAISTSGRIFASGYNDYGVLANGNTTSSGKKGPQGPAIKLGGGTFIASKFAQANSCLDSTIFAFDENGVAHGVGNNPGGNFSIQDGSTYATQHANKGYRPVGLEILAANPGRKIVAISDAGWWRALYLLDDGTVWNSGSNRFYAMGNNGTVDKMYLASPTVTSSGAPLRDIIEAHATQQSSVYLDKSGNLWGAGENQYGELPGLGKTGTKSPYAVRLTNPDGKKVVKIWVNASDCQSVFARTADGVIYVAGNNTCGYASIGHSKASANVWTRVIVPDGKTIAHLEFGGEGGLYLMTDGTVYFAGKNDTGGPGTGKTAGDTTVMTQVPLPGRALDIAGTYMDSYAVIVAE